MIDYKVLTRTILFIFASTYFPIFGFAEETFRQPELANVYDSKKHKVSEYLVSEKLDGVWARWENGSLWFRSGQKVEAPAYFTEGFPQITLEGELWLSRGHYQDLVSIVRDKVPGPRWKKVRLMVFDSSSTPGTFAERHAVFSRIISLNPAPHLDLIDQFEISFDETLKKKLAEITSSGGEGLMLHKKDAKFDPGRSDNILKVKLANFDEAEVIGFKPGKGKLEGMIGSLRVRWMNKEFSIGSGMNNDTRSSPPPIGSLITFKYNGLTDDGIPRFPVYIRPRELP